MVSLSDDARTTCRASSTLERNKQLYGAANMLKDGSSCWNSSQGSPQQGGFVGQDVQIHANKAGQWELTDVDVEPEDCNDLQEFQCSLQRVEGVALTFQRSTDFFGRVVIYRLDVQGQELQLQ